MTKVNRAVSSFKKGYNCSQSIFSTYCEDFYLSADKGRKIACALGGGMGHNNETCGAVSGAIMLIGLKYGNTRFDDKKSKEKAYAVAQEFAKMFKERNGSLKCSELLGCDISTEEGNREAHEKNLFNDKCQKFVKDAAEIIEEIL